MRQMRSYGIHATQSMATPRTIRICFAYYREALGSILDERPNAQKTKNKTGQGAGPFCPALATATMDVVIAMLDEDVN